MLCAGVILKRDSQGIAGMMFGFRRQVGLRAITGGFASKENADL